MQRFGNSDATFTQRLQMRFDRLSDQRLSFLARGSYSDATWQIRHRSTPGGRTFLVNHGISNAHFVSKPESFRIVFRVPVGTSSPNFPATVTNFGLTGCLKI